MTKPNYELLKEAHAIIDGIPNEFFDLSSWVQDEKKYRPGETCNTIACAGGWLAQHPKFNELGLRLAWERGNFGRGANSLSVYHQPSRARNFEALGNVFGIDEEDAVDLFARACSSPLDEPDTIVEYGWPNHVVLKPHITHKQLFLNRVKRYLTK